MPSPGWWVSVETDLWHTAPLDVGLISQYRIFFYASWVYTKGKEPTGDFFFVYLFV